MSGFTHCRCGADALTRHNGKVFLKRECSNINDGKPFVYHDLIAQQHNKLSFTTWDVVPEGNQFRAFAGQDPSPMLFNTPDEAWVELDLVYWGHKEWPEDED